MHGRACINSVLRKSMYRLRMLAVALAVLALGTSLATSIQPASCFAILQYKSIASASCCFSMYSPSVCAT